MAEKKILVYGYGNPGRQDDGLGPFLVDRLEELKIPGIVFDSNYQLSIEDAYDISLGSAVIFIDASIDGKEPFSFERIHASGEITFTTHSISPGSVLALCEELYDRDVPAYLMAVRGYSWEFNETMTPAAKGNMDDAFGFLADKLKEMSQEAC